MALYLAGAAAAAASAYFGSRAYDVVSDAYLRAMVAWDNARSAPARMLEARRRAAQRAERDRMAAYRNKVRARHGMDADNYAKPFETRRRH